MVPRQGKWLSNPYERGIARIHVGKEMNETEEIQWFTPEVTFLCTIPAELGVATKLYLRNGKIICETESGIQMIVPTAEQIHE